MKRKLTAICLLLAFAAALFAGCGARKTVDATPAPQQPTQPTEQTPAAPEPPAQPDAEAEKAYEEAMRVYETVMDQNCDVVYNGYSEGEDYRFVPLGVIEVSSMTRAELLDYLGYTFLDISGDGVPELLIGTIPDDDAEAAETQFFFGGYTIKDGEPVCFLEGWARNVYEWLGDGRFFNYGSGGYAYRGFGTFRIAEDGTELACEDWYFSDLKDKDADEIGFYHNQTGEWDKDAAEELTDLDADGFWALSGRYDAEIKTLPLTPFADYPYTGFIAQPLDCKVRADYFDDVQYGNEYDDASAYMDAGAEYETKVLFRSEEGVKDFKLLSLLLKDVDANGHASYDVSEVFSLPALRAGVPLAVPMNFPGDVPSNGFSYTDTDGATKTYTIGVSGRDGALVVMPLE